jgi:peroxiredoxin
MRKIIFSILCFSIALLGSAQAIHSDSITLSGTVLNDASTPLKPNVRFSTFNQDDPPIFVNINADNSFSKKIKITVPTLYKLTYGGYYVMFLATPNEPEVKFKITDKVGLKSLNLEQSKENDAYYAFRDEMFQFIDSMKYVGQTFANNNVEAIVQANRIIEKHNGYCTNLKQINQGTFAANVLFGSFMMNPFSDKQPFKKQIAEHFFDNVNFADSSLFVIKDMTLIFSDYFDFFADSSAASKKWFFPYIFDKTKGTYLSQKELGFLFIDNLTRGKREHYLQSFTDYLLNQKTILNSNLVLAERINLLANTLPGKSFFEVSGVDVNDQPISLSELVKKAKLTMLIFWEPDCSHCQKEMPKFIALYEKYKSQGFDVFAVSIGNDKDKWRNFINTNNLVWHNGILPTDPSVYSKYYLQSTPITVLIGNDGKIKSRFTVTEELDGNIERHLKKGK